MHNLCVFWGFSTFAQKVFKEWGCNFTWRIGKVMRSKSMKMVFVARIIRHKLCMICAFFYFFWSKIIFDQKLFSYCWDRFDYPGSILYLSCFVDNSKKKERKIFVPSFSSQALNWDPDYHTKYYATFFPFLMY